MTLDDLINEKGFRIDFICEKTKIWPAQFRRYRRKPGSTPISKAVKICKCLGIGLDDYKLLENE